MKNLEVKKVKRSWCICAGRSVLGKFRTEESAKESLEKNEDFYSYWAGSASVSFENSTPKVITV